jgi:hypothetical protein
MRRLRGSEERLRAEEHAQAERGSGIARTPLHDENRKSCHSDKHCLSLWSMPGHKMATTQINFLICHVTERRLVFKKINWRILEMGTRTGRPRGRPKCSKNKRTAERGAATQEMATRIGKAVGGAFEGDAHAYLTSVYKDPSKPENVRIDAPKAAIRYEKPALAPVEQGGPDTDFIPLAKRIEYITRRDASESSASKVVELKKPDQR